jgi:serine protease Do
MHSKIFGAAAVAAVVAALAVGSGAAAQGRPGPDSRTSPQADALPSWFPGVGASIRAEVRDASSAEIAAAGLSQPGGAVVTRVDEEGPAAKAGLNVGDVVVEFDGERVRSARHLVRLVREATEGRAIKMVVSAQKAQRTIEVTPVDGVTAMLNTPEIRRQVERGARELHEELRRQIEEGEGPFGGSFGGRRQLGVELLPVSDQLATYFGVKSGVLIARVRAESPAALAGIKAGDVITNVNGISVTDAGDVAREVRRSNALALTLTVVRDKKELMLTANLPEAERRVPRRTRPA